MTRQALIVSHGHPAYSLGGAEVASYNLFLGLSDLAGWQGHYLARATPPLTRRPGTAVTALRDAPREMLYATGAYDHVRCASRDLAGLERDFVRFVRDLGPDVVNFHHYLGYGVEILHALKRAFPRLPVVVTFHEYLAICHHHGQMVKTGRFQLCTRSGPADCAGCFPEIGAARFFERELYLKSFLEQADAYVSPSRFLIDRYVDWGLERAKFTLIENGLTVDAIAPPRPLAPSGVRNRFAFFGQLTEFKGAHVLIDAVSRVPDRLWGEDGALMIFGGNLDRQPEAYRKRFEAAVERAGDRVRFYGSYRSAELPRLMRDVDWVVMPSVWWENSPVVIQEAFLHGRPVISSDIGGMAEKVTAGLDGLHFRAGSVEDLVDRLCEALGTPGLWERLRGGIRRPMDRGECARRHAALFEALIGQAAGTTAEDAVVGMGPGVGMLPRERAVAGPA